MNYIGIALSWHVLTYACILSIQEAEARLSKTIKPGLLRKTSSQDMTCISRYLLSTI